MTLQSLKVWDQKYSYVWNKFEVRWEAHALSSVTVDKPSQTHSGYKYKIKLWKGTPMELNFVSSFHFTCILVETNQKLLSSYFNWLLSKSWRKISVNPNTGGLKHSCSRYSYIFKKLSPTPSFLPCGRNTDTSVWVHYMKHNDCWAACPFTVPILLTDQTILR